MRMNRSLLRPLLVALAAAPLLASLSGCIVVPAHRYHGYGPGGGGGGYGYRDGPPVSGAIWIEGYWSNDRGGRRWVDGHWDRRR